MKYCYIFTILFSFSIFTNCVSYNNNTSNTANTTQNTQNTTRRNSEINSYVLSKGESLATFIQSQNRLNDYAKHENIPTNARYREIFTAYEELGNLFISIKNEVSEQDKMEFKNEHGIEFDVALDLFSKIGLMYIIEYNERTKVWYLELIGRSTTLKIEMSQTRRDGMSYAHSVISPINRWMELNNISDLDATLRIYINNTENERSMELFGQPFNFGD